MISNHICLFVSNPCFNLYMSFMWHSLKLGCISEAGGSLRVVTRCDCTNRAADNCLILICLLGPKYAVEVWCLVHLLEQVREHLRVSQQHAYQSGSPPHVLLHSSHLGCIHWRYEQEVMHCFIICLAGQALRGLSLTYPLQVFPQLDVSGSLLYKEQCLRSHEILCLS